MSALEALAQAILDERVSIKVVHDHVVGTHVGSLIYIEVDLPADEEDDQ